MVSASGSIPGATTTFLTDRRDGFAPVSVLGMGGVKVSFTITLVYLVYSSLCPIITDATKVLFLATWSGVSSGDTVFRGSVVASNLALVSPGLRGAKCF